MARRLNNQQEIIFGLIDLAQIALEKNDFELAEKYNNEALALERSIGDHDSELYSLVNESANLVRDPDSRTAERLLGKVVHESRNDVKLQVMALWTLARIDAQLSRIGAAKMHYEAAFVSLEEERKSLGRDELKLSYPTNAKDIYSDYIDFLVQHGMDDEAFRVAELQRLAPSPMAWA